MKILFIAHDKVATDLLLRLKNEGHTVSLSDKIDDTISKEKVDLIIYTDSKFGDETKEMRTKGYSVIGGSDKSDKMESDKNIGIKIAQLAGMKISEDLIDGYDVEIGSYFNGIEFMRDEDGDEICEENWKNDLSLNCRKAKESKLFSETLDKLREILKEIDIRGEVNVDCIVTKDGSYFIKFIMRFGHLLESNQITEQWGNFLKAVADGKQLDFGADNEKVTEDLISWGYLENDDNQNDSEIDGLIDNDLSEMSYKIKAIVSKKMSVMEKKHNQSMKQELETSKKTIKDEHDKMMMQHKTETKKELDKIKTNIKNIIYGD